MSCQIEPDGDLHVQLLDRTAPLSASNGYLVVELPDGAPWCAMRAQVLGWTNAHFPLAVLLDSTTGAWLHELLISWAGGEFFDVSPACWWHGSSEAA